MTLWISSFDIFFVIGWCHSSVSMSKKHSAHVSKDAGWLSYLQCQCHFLMPLIYRAIVSRMSRIIRTVHYVPLCALDSRLAALASGPKVSGSANDPKIGRTIWGQMETTMPAGELRDKPHGKGHCLPTSSTEHARQSKIIKNLKQSQTNNFD